MISHAYSYAILQYRHDVWVGESLNAGVLLFSKTARYLKFKARTGQGRLAGAYPDLDHAAFRETVRALERRFDRIANESTLFLPTGDAIEIGRKVLVPDDSSLVWGMTGSGVAFDPEKALDQIFYRFVTKFDKDAGRDVRTDDMVFETVRRKLVRAEIYYLFEPYVVRSKFANISFSHAIKNGKWHVIQGLSFDSADEEHMLNKAARWAGRLQSISECEERVRPYFVTGAPSIPSLMPQYRRMVEFLRVSPLKPVVMDESQADDLVAKVAAHVSR